MDGGFALNREPKDISMLDVIRAVGGGYVFTALFCMMSVLAQKHVWANVQLMKLCLFVQAELVRQMESVTFDKLAVREKEILETMNPCVSHA